MSDTDNQRASFIAGAAVIVPDEHDVVVMSLRYIDNPAEIEDKSKLDEVAESRHIAMTHEHAVQLKGLLEKAIEKLGNRLESKGQGGSA